MEGAEVGVGGVAPIADGVELAGAALGAGLLGGGEDDGEGVAGAEVDGDELHLAAHEGGAGGGIEGAEVLVRRVPVVADGEELGVRVWAGGTGGEGRG